MVGEAGPRPPALSVSSPLTGRFGLRVYELHGDLLEELDLCVWCHFTGCVLGFPHLQRQRENIFNSKS